MSNPKSTFASVEISTANLIILAWIVLLVGSAAPAIIFRLFVPAGPSEPYYPSWLTFAQVVFLAGFWLIAQLYSSLRPLSGFALALIAFILGASIIQPAFLQSAIVTSWLSTASWGIRQLIIYGSKLITVALMALTLIGSNIGRRELFLTWGDPRSHAKPTRFLPGLRESKPWHIVARTWLPFYAVGMLIILWVQMRPDATQFARMLIFLPAIILAAVINAFSEEFQFRSMLISRLQPLLGATPAVLMTSIAFGLGHFSPANIPSGPFGALLAGYLGWVAAKSMIETRGILWAFLLHFLGDFVAYSFAAMATA